MEDQTKQITFRSFINDNTNLLTVAGIFNALAIYTSSIPKYFAKPASFMLLLLSLMILGEVIIASYKMTKVESIAPVERRKFLLFFCFMICVQVCLVMVISQVFTQLSQFLFLGFIFGTCGLIGGLGAKWIISRFQNKKYKVPVLLLLFLLSLAILFFMFPGKMASFNQIITNIKSLL